MCILDDCIKNSDRSFKYKTIMEVTIKMKSCQHGICNMLPSSANFGCKFKAVLFRTNSFITLVYLIFTIMYYYNSKQELMQLYALLRTNVISSIILLSFLNSRSQQWVRLFLLRKGSDFA